MNIHFEHSNPEIYIAAMARSGSTAMANMLSVLPKLHMLIEPTAAVFGFRSYDMLSYHQDRNDYLDHIYKSIEACSGIEAWGLKEVSPAAHTAVIEVLQPRKIIILVRNIRHVFLSLVEKSYRSGPGDPHTMEWIEKYCVKSAKSLLDIDKKYTNFSNIIPVKYEDFYFNIEKSSEIKTATGLSWSGDQFFNLDIYGRSYEITRNQNRTSSKPLSLFERGLNEEMLEISHSIVRKCSEYQCHFGYEY